MRLSNQQLAEVVGFVRKGDRAPNGSERRRSLRMEMRSTISITPIVDGMAAEPITVFTRDISIEGIGLLSGVEILTGRKFIALLPRVEGRGLLVLSEVLNCEPVSTGIFSLSCRFDQVIQRSDAQPAVAAAS